MVMLERESAERLCDQFVNYLFDTYKGSRHVRRIAAWVGLIICGIERVAGTDWKIPRDRQLVFRYDSRQFKARYDHDIGARGGIEIVEILQGRGNPTGRRVVAIATLDEAEAFYDNAQDVLDRFINHAPEE